MKFVSAASFWNPQLFVPSGWIEHAPFAFWLINVHTPNTLVELGTHHGYSYFAFNQAIKALGIKTRSFAVDTWRGDEHAGYYDEDVFERVNAHNEEHYWDFSELIRSTFDEAVHRFPDASIDLLHIDGQHLYSDARHDFDIWRQKLSKRAVVCLHDTNVRVKDFGVYQLWNELKAELPHFEFLHGHGLGILGVGEEFREQITGLFAASDDGKLADTIRAVYSRLGQGLSDCFQLQQTSADLKAHKHELLRLESEIHRLQDHQRELEAANRDRLQLEAELQCLQSEHRQREHADRERELEREKEKDAMTEATETILRLRDQISCAEKMEFQNRELLIARFGSQVDSLRAEIRHSKRQNEQGSARVEMLKAEVNHLSDECRRLAHFEQEYVRAMSSRSWKVTRPLRAGTTLVNRWVKPLLRVTTPVNKID